MTDVSEVSVRTALKQAGLQYTRQRSIVLAILLQSGSHLDAYDIHAEVSRTGESMSLSTVYRVLQAFRDSGLVSENHLGEDHHHYEPSRYGHHHAVCSVCGAVIEFDLSDLGQAAPRLRGFYVKELSVSGVCPECRSEEGNNARS